MLDRRAERLLLFLNSKCEEGVYKIFTTEELLSALPFKDRTNLEGLNEDIKYLEEHEYINCKYKDDKQFCVVPLNKGRLYKEQVTTQKKKDKTFRVFALLAFIGGIVGGAIGGVVSGFIVKLF